MRSIGAAITGIFSRDFHSTGSRHDSI
jgi:hypothetical protein